MSQSQKAKEIQVGLTVIIAIAMMYLALTWVNRTHLFAPADKQITIHFDQVNGLLEGDPVLVRGYQIGRVSAIMPRPDYVEVQASIDEDVLIYDDAQATIQIKELMGGKQISLNCGMSTTPLPAGIPVPGNATPDFSSAFGIVGDLSENFDSLDLEMTLKQFQILLAHTTQIVKKVNPETVESVFDRANSLLYKMDRTFGKLEQSNLLTQVDSTLTNAQPLISQTENTLFELEKLLVSMNNRFIPKGDTILTQLSQTLNTTDLALNEALVLLEEIRQPKSLTGKMISDPAFANRVDSTLYHLILVLRQLQNDRIKVGIQLSKKSKK